MKDQAKLKVGEISKIMRKFFKETVLPTIKRYSDWSVYQ